MIEVNRVWLWGRVEKAGRWELDHPITVAALRNTRRRLHVWRAAALFFAVLIALLSLAR